MISSATPLTPTTSVSANAPNEGGAAKITTKTPNSDQAAEITMQIPNSDQAASTAAIAAAVLGEDVLKKAPKTQSGRVTIPIPDEDGLDWNAFVTTEEIEVIADGNKYYFSVKYSPSDFCICQKPKAGHAPKNIDIACSVTEEKIKKIDDFHFIPLCVGITDSNITIEIVPCKFQYESLRQDDMEKLVYKKAPEKGAKILDIQVPVNFGGRKCYLKWEVLTGITHSNAGLFNSHNGVKGIKTPLDVYSTDGERLTDLGRFFVIGSKRHSLKIWRAEREIPSF